MGQGSSGKRGWLGILFRCCNIYYRIYKNEKGDSYQGRCPKCGKRVEILVGKEGVKDRFFRAE